MAIPQSTVDDILVRCARHCCVCRRSRPLLLQVHHIRERANGGTDHPDNLIATCISCHAEVHTETKLTRRFTDTELKKHRDEVYRLVGEGVLPVSESCSTPIDELTARLLGMLVVTQQRGSDDSTQLVDEAFEILLAAVEGPGYVNAIEYDGGFAVVAGAQQFDFRDNPRKMAALRRAMQQLESNGLLDRQSKGLYYVAHDGFALADNLMAAATDRMADEQSDAPKSPVGREFES